MKLNTVKQVKSALEKAKSEYEAKIAAIIEQVRVEQIVPLCKQHGFNFLAGNGMYVFLNQATKAFEEKETFPKVMKSTKELSKIMDLYMEDYGFRADAFGTMMGNYEK